MAQAQASYGMRLIRWVGLAMGLPAVLAVALLGSDTALVIGEVDHNALEHQQAAVDQGVKLLGDLRASELIALTLWDEAYRNVVVSRKPAWIKANYGREAVSDDGEQHFLIIDATGNAIFSSLTEDTPAAASVAPTLTAITSEMNYVREMYRKALADGKGFGKRQPGALTEGIYANDLVVIDGRPALVTVSPFAPDVADQATPAEATLLVGIQVMNEAIIAKLAAMAHVSGLRVVSADDASAAQTQLHTLRDAGGNPIARVTWTFKAPGTAVLRAATPAIGVSIALLALLTVGGALAMRRLTRRLAESEQAALYASRHDAATGLANRGWFMSVFSQMREKSGAATDRFAVMLIDCDYFKTINDTLGHAAGDAVLQAVAARLKGLGNRLSIASRLGGDEFTLISTPLRNMDETTSLLAAVSSALMQPVTFETHTIKVSVSIGAAMFSRQDEASIDALLARADSALYRAKHDGRGCARLYDPAIDTNETLPPPVGRPANDASAVIAAAPVASPREESAA